MEKHESNAPLMIEGLPLPELYAEPRVIAPCSIKGQTVFIIDGLSLSELSVKFRRMADAIDAGTSSITGAIEEVKYREDGSLEEFVFRIASDKAREAAAAA